ncbi:MAG: NUDIX hydrolase [Pseudomonadota bacterium]
MVWKPRVTVAAIACRDDRFLLVEETVNGRLVLNQPAGHLEQGESLLEAVVREAREESASRFTPESLVGVYHWTFSRANRTTLRFAYAGQCTAHDPEQALDAGITRTVWLTRDQIAADPARLRSSLVLRCVDDYLSGARYPLGLVRYLPAIDTTP